VEVTVRRVGLAVLLGAAFCAGCGGPAAVVIAPVGGKVTLDGAPVASGQVSFLPADQSEGAAGMSAGAIDANGEYKIFTAGKSGAPPGKYTVTVTPLMVPAPGATAAPIAPFNAMYSNVGKTPLHFEVVNSPEPGRYDLKLTK
jgi:hypothetical protein